MSQLAGEIKSDAWKGGAGGIRSSSEVVNIFLGRSHESIKMWTSWWQQKTCIRSVVPTGLVGIRYSARRLAVPPTHTPFLCHHLTIKTDDEVIPLPQNCIHLLNSASIKPLPRPGWYVVHLLFTKNWTWNGLSLGSVEENIGTTRAWVQISSMMKSGEHKIMLQLTHMFHRQEKGKTGEGTRSRR